MAPKKYSDRCCNPFKLAKHRTRKGLRRVSESLQAKWQLTKQDYLCTSCRNTLEKKKIAIDKNVEQ